MAKGRFLNQKLGKRTDRKSQMPQARLTMQRPATQSDRAIKPADSKGPSR